jgi:hypothetical protein
MNLEIFTLCNSADGRDAAVSIVAASDRLYGLQAPCKVPHCALVFRIHFGPSEAGKHEIAIAFVDQAGNAIIPANKRTITAAIPDDQSTCTYNGIMGLGGVVFPKFGEYRLDLIVDGVILGSQPFYFNQAAAPATN